MASANASAIAARLPVPAVEEPISPELVLVDPELRRALSERPLRPTLQVVRDRADDGRPADVEPLVVPPAGVSTAAEARLQPPAAPAPRSHTRVAAALLSLSVTLNVILIALAISDARVTPEAVPPSEVPTALPTPSPGTATTPPKSPPAKASRPAKKRPPAVASPRRRATAVAGRAGAAAVERKVLTAVVQSPVGKLPRSLIDPRTGLAKNNLQSRCRGTAAGVYLCVVRPARHAPGEGVSVRYRSSATGSGVLDWGRYRVG